MEHESITSRPLSHQLSHPIQTRKRKEEEEEDLYDFIFGLFVTWVCDEREDDDNLRQLKGKWTTCMEWQSMLVVRGWCSMSVYVHLCMYVYTSCLFTYFFLTQIMKGKANQLCRTYWLIFRSRCTPKKISKKVSTSQVIQ